MSRLNGPAPSVRRGMGSSTMTAGGGASCATAGCMTHAAATRSAVRTIKSGEPCRQPINRWRAQSMGERRHHAKHQEPFGKSGERFHADHAVARADHSETSRWSLFQPMWQRRCRKKLAVSRQLRVLCIAKYVRIAIFKVHRSPPGRRSSLPHHPRAFLLCIAASVGATASCACGGRLLGY